MNPTPSPTPVQPPPVPVAILDADYRYGKVDVQTFPARDNRPARTIITAIHTIEVDARTLEVREELPPTTDVVAWKQPLPKGTAARVAIDITTAKVLQIVNGRPQESRGLWRIRVLSITPRK